VPDKPDYHVLIRAVRKPGLSHRHGGHRIRQDPTRGGLFKNAVRVSDVSQHDRGSAHVHYKPARSAVSPDRDQKERGQRVRRC
jgi:hypothetical protein